ncbi:oligosaccharide flippase family protein [Pseudomonas sp. WS 5106]|uniref:Oligosaccharide flippase family protein n=1 Tax=Pseudomonas cremoris TaxID=2724178 RepID=A0A7X1AM72_9PSED|nr:oligosaccharide flippase family protein [Pseudomonas cremoris]MBC2382860.1 oligosaccharide flippase family protein [Pseudomonas cremoris]MBC2406291.1 oligosaccharide flippase family protein [Pseudomonas cremoris]MBC2406927.1 oligosaccharide flippase family protein [Pseudomonas cremoris]
MALISKYLPKGAFARNVLTLMTGTTLAQAIPIAVSPILTRLYSPSEFGVFAVYLAIVSVLAILATGRYELAIMVPKKDRDAAALVIVAFSLSVLVSLAILVVILIFNEQIARILKIVEYRRWLYWIPLSVVLTAGYQSLNYWSNRRGYYRRMSSTRMAQSAGMSAVHVGAGYAGRGMLGLIVGAVVGQLVAFCLLLWSVRGIDQSSFKKLSGAKLLSVSRRYIDFPKFLVIAHSLNIASFQSPVMLLGSIFGAGAAGYFMLTQRVIGAPMSIVAGAIGDVFRQQASEAYSRTGSCREIYKKTFFRLLSVAVIPFCMFFFVAPGFFALVFGEAWRASGEYAQILIPMFFVQFITSPLSSMFMIAQRQKIDLLWQISLFASVLIVFGVGYFFDSLILGLYLFSAAYTCMYAVNGFVSFKLSGGSR